MKSDYSDYLMDPEKLDNEEAEWARQGFYLKNAQAVLEVVDKDAPTSIVELGCGTGLVASQLQGHKYAGVDKNFECIKKAQDGNPGMQFYCADVRDFCMNHHVVDIVCCFAFLKHFALFEWDDILGNMLRFGIRGVFAVAISDNDLDDGTDFPHTSVTLDHLTRAVTAAGHKIIKTEHQADSATGYEMLVWTERV